MTQGELAARLKVGQQAVSNWERGTSRPETAALVLRLAQIFPEHDPALWREATEYRETPGAGAAPRALKSKPVQPLLETLPLDRLSFQQFQSFSALLLELLYNGNAIVNQFGVEGDAQDGIDIEARFSNGRYETFQCKREKTFGPEKVRRAIRKQKVKCDRAVILLSRRATVAARKAIPKSGKWELWDTEDIARKIRTLPLAKQKRIVATYFRAYRKTFLGVDDGGALESPEEHFAPLLQRDHVFSHAWTLAGRDRELEKLIALTDRTPREITLLVGSGGIGKSRLMRALADAYRKKYPDHAVFILSAGRVPSSTDFDVLAEQPSLLIIEDAHEHPQIRAFLATLARVTSPVRLLITARPYAAQLIRSEALQTGLRADDEGTITLQSLTIDQAESVAREILADRKGPVQLARDIARLTRGSSLALVVGSYLVATARIHPSVLNNSQQFRDELFGRFRDALTGQIGPESQREIIRDTLNLIALLQPIDLDSPALDSLAEHVLQLRIDKVKRAIQLLHDAGVLIRRGRMFSIVPDLLAEYILEDTCVLKANGGSSGYIERVMAQCDEKQLANILLNVSKLDWRLSEADESQSRLADAVWKQVETAYGKVPAAQDTVVEAVASAAYYQPGRALNFYDRLKELGHSHKELATLLKHAAMNFEHVDDAAYRLWELGQGDRRQLNQYPSHPLRILNELAAIEPGKPVEYCERIVRFAMHLIDTGQSGTGEQSAFGVLRAALATEGHTMESRGHSIVMSGFGVRRDAVASLRLTIIDFLRRQLGAADLQAAIQAAGALEDALRYPHGLFGRVPTEEERRSWSAEFIETLRKIRSMVKAGNLDPFVTIRLQRTINWHAHFAGPPTGEEARAVLDGIPQTLAYRVSLALADGWGHLSERSDDIEKAMTVWQEEQKRIGSDLILAFPNAADTLAFLRERLRTLRSIEGGGSSPEIFVRMLSETHPELAGAICESVITDPGDPFRDVFGGALYQFAMARRERALVLARAALDLGDVVIARSVSGAYGARLHSRERIQSEERALAERLVRSDDDFTAMAIIRGIAAQAAADRSWTLATLLAAPIDRSPKIADEVFCMFTHPGELPFKSLGEPTVLACIDKLAACPSIENHWVEEFLAAASRTVPSRVIQFMIERIERDAGGSVREFQPMPYLWDEHPRLKFRETADLAAHLKTIREWLLSTRKNMAKTFWGPKLYRSVAVDYDQVVLADLDAWMKSGDAEKLAVVARILSEAPQGFVFDQRAFVVELLEHAATVSQKCLDGLSSALWGSAISGMRHGVPGEPFPEDETRRNRSAEALAQMSRQSPAWSLFNSLKRDAERDITHKQQEDEELFDE